MVFNKSLNSNVNIKHFTSKIQNRQRHLLRHIVFIYVYLREFMCVYSFVQTSDVAQVPEEKAAHCSRAQLTRKPSDNGENMLKLFSGQFELS